MIFLAALLAAVAAGILLDPLARRVGLVDRREGLEHRKPRRRVVTLSGGLIVLVGAAVGGASMGALPGAAFPWPAALGAFALGLVDDVVPGGLGARIKLLGQLLVALLFAWHPGAAWPDPGLLDSVGLALLALTALNAVNLFDHADGLAGGLCAVALAPVAPLWSGAFAGYLPFNTLLRQREQGPASTALAADRSSPRAMLGDSGSHLAAILVIQAPASSWLLLIPLIDMVRVALGRARAGRPFWVGDRTHVGHRLAAVGFTAVEAAGVSLLFFLPPVLVGAFAEGPVPVAWGHFGGLLVYLTILSITEEPMGEAQAREAESGELVDLTEPLTVERLRRFARRRLARGKGAGPIAREGLDGGPSSDPGDSGAAGPFAT